MSAAAAVPVAKEVLSITLGQYYKEVDRPTHSIIQSTHFYDPSALLVVEPTHNSIHQPQHLLYTHLPILQLIQQYGTCKLSVYMSPHSDLIASIPSVCNPFSPCGLLLLLSYTYLQDDDDDVDDYGEEVPEKISNKLWLIKWQLNFRVVFFISPRAAAPARCKQLCRL